MPVIVIGADTPGGEEIVSRLLSREGEVRAFVTDLLERDIPAGGETERTVRDAMQRLRLASRVQQN